MADQPISGGPQAGGFLTEQDYSAGTLVNLAGAAVSLALVVGISVWGYQLLSRDVSGVPVVKAVQGDMRVLPKDPGGVAAANQGLSVNKVAAEGLAAAPVDELVLAPPPINLNSEDTPAQAVAATAAPDAAATNSANDRLKALSNQMSEDQFASIQAMADQLAAEAEPLDQTGVAQTETTEEEGEVSAADTAEEDVSVEAAVVERVDGGIGRSLRPRARPETLLAAAQSGDDAVTRAASDDSAGPASSSAPASVDPESIPAGTRMVQLGAYASEDIALSEWGRLGEKFTDYLDGKSRVIQKATSGGRVFYRLRAMGFGDINDARRFCSALIAEGADCIPVVTR